MAHPSALAGPQASAPDLRCRWMLRLGKRSRPLDLRRALVLRLALAWAALLLGFALVGWQDLRDDALAEQAAASRLVELVLASQGPGAQAAVAGQLQAGPLRHVRARLQETSSEVPAQSAPPTWLAMAPAQTWRIPVGPQMLLIEPDPHSELREKAGAASQAIALLGLFAAASLMLTWWAVHKALQPARELEAGLDRLQTGQAQAQLPTFALREFQAIADKMEHLASALEQARAQQHRLTRELMQVQDTERRQLATELHDEFGQSLTAISATAAYLERHAGHIGTAQVAESARDIGQASRRIQAQVRDMLTQLRPYGLAAGDLDAALRELLGSWQSRQTGLRWSGQVDALPELPQAVGLALYRCLQEALTNAVRHSQARHIEVSCRVQAQAVVLSVADDGCGQAGDVMQRAGNGLLGLRERVQQVGGQLHLQDRHGGGLVLCVQLPWEARA